MVTLRVELIWVGGGGRRLNYGGSVTSERYEKDCETPVCISSAQQARCADAGLYQQCTAGTMHRRRSVSTVHSRHDAQTPVCISSAQQARCTDAGLYQQCTADTMHRRRSVSAVHSRHDAQTPVCISSAQQTRCTDAGHYNHVLSSGDTVYTGDMTTVHGRVSEFVLFARY